jgi:hypothetical protein
MANRTMIVMLAGSALLTLSSTALAQRWGREEVPREGACFFKDPNFHGEYFCIRTGRNVGSVPGDMNDRISSIRIFGRAEVTVFKDVQFDGRSERFDTDIRNLKAEGWNDLISSVRVRHISGGGFDGRRDDNRGFGRRDDVGRRDDPDRIVRRAYQDVLDREPDQAGLRLYRSRIIDDGWSEAQVREALRTSPEYREKSTMTMPKAQEVVRRAYLAVLGREPDPGSRSYVVKVFREHWSQEDVERELRKSPEYRNSRRR